MFAQVHSPDELTPTELDHYLAQGWYRMGQSIFTTNFIHFKSEMYSTIWLRISLDEYLDDRTQTKLFKQNSVFRTSIQPALLTAEKEELYERYRQVVPFRPSESLQQLLYGNKEVHFIYHTYEITIHHGDQLIAIGFFDLGKTSAAGITSVYDPIYKKYSLGKYLIYQKMKYCKDLKLQYFYPGYFVPGYSFFDYKLKMGQEALQYLSLTSQQWEPIRTFSPASIPYHVMFDQLSKVQIFLRQRTIETSLVKYEYFDSNLIPELREEKLLDFPVFLLLDAEIKEDVTLILVFDVRDHQFHLLLCVPMWKANQANPDKSYYSAYYLKAIQEIHSISSAEKMAEFICKSVAIKI